VPSPPTATDPIRGWQPYTSGDNRAQPGTPPHIAVSADAKTVLTVWGRSNAVPAERPRDRGPERT
jgi:hypothetical protein